MAEQKLKNKTAFIAGGTSGINLAIAKKMGKEGANLVLLGRDPEKAQRACDEVVKEGGQAIPIAADVRDSDAITEAMATATKHFDKPIDIVISGAAGNFLCNAAKLSANGFKAVVDIDLIGTFNVFRAAFDVRNTENASFISITAPQAESPYYNQAHACAAKAGVNMLTKCLALEWGQEKVRVNAISPGPIANTEGVSRLMKDNQDAYLSRLPLGRYGTGEDVAHLAIFLCTEESSYITGSIMSCDGGCGLGSEGFKTFSSDRQHIRYSFTATATPMA